MADSPKIDATGAPVWRSRAAASAVASCIARETSIASAGSLRPGGQPRPR